MKNKGEGMGTEIEKDTNEAAGLKEFQEAARKIMQRVFLDDKYAYVMIGTDVYESVLKAYALSLGKELPRDAAMQSVEDIWKILHGE
jgi:hypothetical protein